MMHEEVFSIPLGDGHSLYGRINRAERATKAIILCHGLTGHIYEHQYQLARIYFVERGYDVIRINFYSGEDDARRIVDCTVALHAEDLKKVVAHFSPRYATLYAAGHSFGGLTLLMANAPEFTAVSLWDGTFIPFAEEKVWTEGWTYNKELDEVIVDWPPIKRVIGKKFYEETQSFTTARMTVWAEAFTQPAQVIAAGAFPENLPHQQRLFQTLKGKKDYAAIAGASHGFNEGETVFRLLDNTHRWFEVFERARAIEEFKELKHA